MMWSGSWGRVTAVFWDVQTTESELKHFFSAFGAVRDCKIIFDRGGLSKRFVWFLNTIITRGQPLLRDGHRPRNLNSEKMEVSEFSGIIRINASAIMNHIMPNTRIFRLRYCCRHCGPLHGSRSFKITTFSSSWKIELSLLEHMTNANVTAEHTANTVIENTVNYQRKQNKHLGIKEDLHSLFGHIGSV